MENDDLLNAVDALSPAQKTFVSETLIKMHNACSQIISDNIDSKQGDMDDIEIILLSVMALNICAKTAKYSLGETLNAIEDGKLDS